MSSGKGGTYRHKTCLIKSNTFKISCNIDRAGISCYTIVVVIKLLHFNSTPRKQYNLSLDTSYIRNLYLSLNSEYDKLRRISILLLLLLSAHLQEPS